MAASLLGAIDDDLDKEFEDGGGLSPSNDEEEEDVEVSKRRHSKLLSAINSLNGKKRRFAAQRSEPSSTISEFNVTEAGHDKVKLHELVLSLGDNATHSALKKQVRQAQRKNKVLPVPLPKPQAEKIKRNIVYDKVKDEVAQWDSVVERNRLSEHTVFPLKKPDLRLYTAPQKFKSFKPVTPLELEIAALLEGSKNVLREDKPMTVAEEEALQAMDVEEALARRNELQKIRALQSYMEAKARRQNKIKSKRYHRLLKRERIKKQVKDFEDLQRTDPDAALDKLEEINKQRILERMTLKHRGQGSKWAKQMGQRAKYDLESRKQLVEQLQLSRELTQKKAVALRENVDDDSDNEGDAVQNSRQTNVSMRFANPSDEANPWVSGKETGSGEGQENSEEVVGYKKVWKETQEKVESQKKKRRKKKKTAESAEDRETRLEREARLRLEQDVQRRMADSRAKEDNSTQKKKRRKKAKKIATPLSEPVNPAHEEDEPMLEERAEYHDPKLLLTGESVLADLSIPLSSEPKNRSSRIQVEETSTDSKKPQRTGKAKDVQVDPRKFLTVSTTKVKSAANRLIVAADDDLDDEEGDEEMDSADEQRMTIAEAFADDDVISSFKEEKQAIVDQNKPKDIDLFIPGWGSWAGTGLKTNERKRKRFTIPAPPPAPRKDQNMGNLIINEKKDSKIAALQISELPFPFTNVDDFEKSMRAPIGKTWNAETAFRKLIAPKVGTKLGAIIEPIDGEGIVKKKKTRTKGTLKWPADKKDDK